MKTFLQLKPFVQLYILFKMNATLVLLTQTIIRRNDLRSRIEEINHKIMAARHYLAEHTIGLEEANDETHTRR
jgi:hypothetical protein